MTRTGWSFRALLPVLCLIPSLAFAQLDPKREALRHYDSALSLMKERAYLRAIPEFERAYELGRELVVLYDLAEAYLAANQPVHAIDTLARYLREGQARISDAQRSKIEAEIARQELRVATLTVVSDVAGAVVRLDGVELGRTPVANGLRVNAGPHRLTAEANGYRRWELNLDLVGKERKVVEIRLEPERPAVAVVVPVPALPLPMPAPDRVRAAPVASAPTMPPGSTPGSAAAAPSGGPTIAPAPGLAASGSDGRPDVPRSRTRKVAAYVVGGLGVGALAVGTVFGIRAISKQNESNDQCPNRQCSEAAVRLNEQAKTAAWVADFTIGAGLVGVGVAAYLLIRSPVPKAGASHAMHVVPEVGPGQAGLALGGVW